MTDSLSLAGRTALVTGASGGIGAALVQRLLDEGVRVIGTARRLESLPQSTEAFVPLQADMASIDVLTDFALAIEREYGPIDLLLPNAGRAEVRSLADVTLAEWQATLDVNITAPFLLAQVVAPRMAERGFGRVLFTSSAAAFVGGFVGPHYAASKAALHGLVHILSARLASSGVTVNAIAPALIEQTAMLEGASGLNIPAPPVGRLGRPDEIADTAVAILRNGYLTGQVLLVDGGLHPR